MNILWQERWAHDHGLSRGPFHANGEEDRRVNLICRWDPLRRDKHLIKAHQPVYSTSIGLPSVAWVSVVNVYKIPQFHLETETTHRYPTVATWHSQQDCLRLFQEQEAWEARILTGSVGRTALTHAHCLLGQGWAKTYMRPTQGAGVLCTFVPPQTGCLGTLRVWISQNAVVISL